MKALQDLLAKYGEKEAYPIAIVGSPVRELKTKTELPIRRITSREETSELVASYTGVRSLSYPLLIEDLAFLSPQVHQQLLKFLEESPLQVVLLSTYDVFTPPLLSRIKTFIKAPLERTQSKFMSPSAGRESINLSKDTHPLDRIRHQGLSSPLIYYDEKTIPPRPNRQKIISILEE